MPQLFLKIRLSRRQRPGHQNRGNNRTDTTYKPSFNCYFLVISHFCFSKYKNLKLFCLQQPLVIIQEQDNYDTNCARRVAFRHHHIESLSGFASIYTPTLIFSYPIVVFHFPVANILLFFFSCILFGHFFRRNIEKGVKEFNLRSQLLIIYTQLSQVQKLQKCTIEITQKKAITRKRRKILKRNQNRLFYFHFVNYNE